MPATRSEPKGSPGSHPGHSDFPPEAGPPEGVASHTMKESTRSTLLGAMFLTATSAIGPGFITGERARTLLVVGFIAVTFLAVGSAPPQQLLVLAGAFNGLLLPIGIGVILWVAWRRADLFGGYHYPRWLAGIGTVAWLLTVFLAVRSIQPVIELLS